MKLVGLISDTHGRLPDAALGALANCNHIIHAGDICDPGILRELQIMAPTTAVLGNNDYDEYGKNVTRFAHPVIDGVRFLVAHYPNDARIGFNGCRRCACTGIPTSPRSSPVATRTRQACSSAREAAAARAAGSRRRSASSSWKRDACEPPAWNRSTAKCCWRWAHNACFFLSLNNISALRRKPASS